MKNTIPVITIDGTSGSGKGTIARALAQQLGWHLLDSGAIYRAFAWDVLQKNIDPTDLTALKKLVTTAKLELREDKIGNRLHVFCDDQEITAEIRSEECSKMASKISAVPFVREATNPYLRIMRRAPGLVADGRDMGTVVFPDAEYKFFLTASATERARRRQAQLSHQGIQADLAAVEAEIIERDRRDRERDIAPTIPAEDAAIIDTTHLSIEEVLAEVLQHVES